MLFNFKLPKKLFSLFGAFLMFTRAFCLSQTDFHKTDRCNGLKVLCFVRFISSMKDVTSRDKGRVVSTRLITSNGLKSDTSILFSEWLLPVNWL